MNGRFNQCITKDTNINHYTTMSSKIIISGELPTHGAPKSKRAWRGATAPDNCVSEHKHTHTYWKNLNNYLTDDSGRVGEMWK